MTGHTAPRRESHRSAATTRTASAKLSNVFRKALAPVVAVATISGLSLVVGTQTAAADDMPQPKVAFTGGIGLYLRDSPTMATHLATAVPEGTPIPDECELTGEPVTNVHGQTITTWVRSPGGVYFPGAFLDTGYLERTPGVPECSEIDRRRQIDFDAARPQTIGDKLRAGETRIYNVSSDRRTAREYFSKAETRRVAKSIDRLADARDGTHTIGCAIYGLGLAVITKGTSFRIQTTIGTLGGLGCDVFLDGFPGDKIRYAADVARGAAETGKCFEVRLHKENGEWVPDKTGAFTSTDHPDWCG
jgi:hypothetical protein